MFKTRQAASEISEDQILNFLVNELTDEFTVDFGGNADVDGETLFEVLAGACADGTSVSSLCKTSEDSPHENTVLYHLREKLDLASVERAGNNLLQTDVLETLPEQLEVVVDLHLWPYYGDEDESEGLYHSEAKRGTTAFHAATLYARVRNKRYTLAVRRLVDGDTASRVLAEFLGSSTAVTLASRPSISIADSTTASVSRCCRRTTTPTSCRSSAGERNQTGTV